MVYSSESVLIARPLDEVFDFAADLRNDPLWDVEVDAVTDPCDVPPEVGKRYAVRFSPFLAESDGTLTAVEVIPGERMVLHADFAGLTSTITYLFTSDGPGTRFTRQVQVRPAGMLRVLAPVIVRRVRRANRRDVRNLKRVLESS